MIEFVASGSPRAVSQAIEEYAAGQRTVSAMVVPWESDLAVLKMSVTAVSGDGWAIEHTNLGTIRLMDLGNERTQVSAAGAETIDPDQQKRAVVFDRFAQQIQSRFRVST